MSEEDQEQELEDQEPEQQQVDPIVEQEARLLGWQPLENYKGDPKNWKSAEDYLEHGRQVNAYLRRDLDRFRQELRSKTDELNQLKEVTNKFAEYHSQTEERAYKKALADLRKERVEAYKEGDYNKVQEIEDQLDELRDNKPSKAPVVPQKQDVVQPDPAFVEWHAQNSWYGTDPELTSIADAYSNVIGKANPYLRGTEFLLEVTRKVQEKFPEKFGSPTRTVAKPNRERSVNNGSKKGFDDLPDDAKKACNDFVSKGWIKSKEEYVKEYFAQKGV